MAKRRTNLSEGKQNIIAALLKEYYIQSAEYIQDALKDLLGGTIQSMLEAEMDNHLGYELYERSGNSNARNGRKLYFASKICNELQCKSVTPQTIFN